MMVSPYALAVASGGGYAALNTSDVPSTVTLSNSNLTATKSATSDRSIVVADTGVSSGKFMFEATVVTRGTGEIAIGLIGGGGDPSQYLGDSARSIALNSAVGVITNATGGSAVAMSVGDVLTCYADPASNKAWFAKNGTMIVAGDPVAGTGGTSISSMDKAWYPAIGLAASSAVLTANFGGASFSYPLTGYSGITSAAAPVGLGTFRSARLACRSLGYFSHAVAEFELLTSSGGSTIFSGGTPGGSGPTTGGSAANMVDGNTTTHFDQGSTGAQDQKNVWFGYDFGSSATRNVSHIAVRSRDGGGGAQNQAPTLAALWVSSDNSVFWRIRPRISFSAWGANTPGDRQVVAL